MAVKQKKEQSEYIAVDSDDSNAKSYELMVIIRHLLSEDERLDAQKKISDIFQQVGGEITNTDVWGKRHLAYEIDGQTEGYYIVYKCTLPNQSANTLESELRLDNNILRFLLIREENL